MPALDAPDGASETRSDEPLVSLYR
jgi:hypothetical protein